MPRPLFAHLSLFGLFGNVTSKFTTVLSDAQLIDKRRSHSAKFEAGSSTRSEAVIVKEGYLMYREIEDELLDEGTSPWKSGRFLLKYVQQYNL